MTNEIERLKAVAILRDGQMHERGFRSHYELRMALTGEDRSRPGDKDGFVTSTGRFVDRDQARHVAIAAGQISPQWKTGTRKLLSSDVNW